MTENFKLEAGKYYKTNDCGRRYHIIKRTAKYVWFGARHSDGSHLRGTKLDRRLILTDEAGNEWVPDIHYLWKAVEITREQYNHIGYLEE